MSLVLSCLVLGAYWPGAGAQSSDLLTAAALLLQLNVSPWAACEHVRCERSRTADVSGV